MKQIHSLAQFHALLSLPKPLHPLVSVVRVSELHLTNTAVWTQFATDFYTISLKDNIQSKVKYGLQYYDFDTGTMTFIAPNQVQTVEPNEANASNEIQGTGYVLMFHPDFLATHPLAADIHNYGFFAYAVNEALHLSEKEKKDVVAIFEKIATEYQHIDKHTQAIILSHLDLLLHYSNRFYERQFITRTKVNHDLVANMEQLLHSYFDTEAPLLSGLPTVGYLAEQLHVSPRYLSDMLRSVTGQNTQYHIHEYVLAKAKEKLVTTNQSVGEIAFALGFEHSQSFNKLFKSKINQTPLAYRQSFRR
ncbi:Helix-turn-helix domain-containing protein [Pustulibacterium marinum]|uniref:Helix-turn-helix domain-containing protein n=1 Tax=Pustulibacterium marinum TaxID=1224947 RepID=A0A1I7I190_9FLAO|nr:response regulator transcription factor [Pustulibacterium marinum]SFU66723.1 Helix-turn-helix domain-containing protein [Pustulibacterium marinum]